MTATGDLLGLVHVPRRVQAGEYRAYLRRFEDHDGTAVWDIYRRRVLVGRMYDGPAYGWGRPSASMNALVWSGLGLPPGHSDPKSLQNYGAHFDTGPEHGHRACLKAFAKRADRLIAWRLGERVKAALTDELRALRFRGRENPVVGHCYVASEALWHLLGGPESGYTPHCVRHEGETHWYLIGPPGGFYGHRHVLDVTAEQFKKPVPYGRGRGKGFLTRKPSKRAREVMRRVQQGGRG